MGLGVDDLKRLVREGLAPETLPEAPPPSPRANRRRSALRILLATEALPEAPPVTGRSRTSLLLLLFRREELPLEPARIRTRRPWIATLFATERLDPPGATGPEVR
jgi:hypothetical protein